MPSARRHTLDTARRALEHVSADCDRETWVRILAALKSEFGDDARELAREWSARGATFKPADFRSAWKSLRPDGGVTFGTLIAEAKAGGFTWRDDEAKGTAAPAARSGALAERYRDEAARTAQRRDQAAAAARRRWDAASDEGRSPYLERKQAPALGVRFEPDGTLLVPMRDAAGELRSVQAIAPDGSKRFPAGAQKSDLWHELGAVADAPVLALAEGYATAATIHAATTLPTAVAFDAGNLPHVARLLRAKYPAALLVVCADDDRATAARGGKNPGLQAAREAVKLGHAVVAVPAPLGGAETDFNDLAQRAGLPAVATIVDAAIAQARERAGAPAIAAAAPDADRVDPFEVSDRGVFFVTVDAKSGQRRAEYVCGPLAIVARTRDADGRAWGYLVEFHDPEGTCKRLALSARLFAGDGAELRAQLLDEGLDVAVGSGRARVAHYIVTRRPARLVHCVDRIGWQGSVYVLPHQSYGPGSDDVFYQPADERAPNTFRQRGTLAGWREGVAALCVGNPRLLLVVGSAFAGPCLHLVDALGGGFHLYGASSKGKTTALAVGAGVWGRSDVGRGGFIRTWRATGNALEGAAAAHNDATMFLDELRELDPREAVAAALMLGNGTGKQRMRTGGGQRAALSWRLLFVSTGERTLAELAALAAQTVDVGSAVRLVELPMPEHGMFDALHGAADGAAFAHRLRAATLNDYGVAGDAWLAYLTAHRDEAAAFLRECSRELLASWAREHDAGQTRRVAARFALVAAAGELATRAEITGWPVGAAERAAGQLFSEWTRARGTRGDAEALAALRQVAALLSQHAESYFPWWHRGADDRRPNAPRRWGLRRMLDTDGNEIHTDGDHLKIAGDEMSSRQGEQMSARFYVFVSAWRDELCRGFDPRYVARILQRRGHLLPESEHRLDRKERLPGVGPVRCFVVQPSLFADDAL